MSIMGNMVGSYSQIGKTFVITDESGSELTGVVTEKEIIFDATDNDVRENKVYAGDAGVSIGTKVIPIYHTAQGFKLIPVGSAFAISLSELDMYDFTELQTLMCKYNISVEKSVSTEKVSISDGVYNVTSTERLANVTKNSNEKKIEFNIINNDSVPYIIRYFTYKEIY